MNITTGNFTLAAWVNVDAAPVVKSAGIVSRATNGAVTRLLALELNANTTTPQFELYDGTNNPFVTGLANLISTGWRHLAGVRDSGTLRLYVDGAQVNTASDTAGDLSGGATQAWRIGSRADSEGLPYDGRIAEVGIWTAALAPGEIAALARGVMVDHVRPASLVSYPPIWGLHSPEIDLKTPSVTWTVTGATAASHAPVVPFSRRFWSTAPPPVVVAGGRLLYQNPLDGLGNYYRGGAS